MSDTITINPTIEHIRAGVPNEPASCPIALAIRDMYGYNDEYPVRVGGASVFIGDDKYVDDTGDLGRFICHFDDEVHVEDDGSLSFETEDAEWILEAEIELTREDS